MPGPFTIFAQVDCWEATLNHEKGRNEANSYLSSASLPGETGSPLTRDHPLPGLGILLMSDEISGSLHRVERELGHGISPRPWSPWR